MSKSVMPKSKAKTAYGLLSEIRKLILDEPQRYDQFNWTWFGQIEDAPDHRAPACGTVCCIAGWVSTMKFRKQITKLESEGWENSPVYQRARRVLGLDSDLAYQLFRSDAAGDRFVQSVEQHADRGAAHIAAFQKKYAKQLKAKRV